MKAAFTQSTQMTAHELANALLSMPDGPVYVEAEVSTVVNSVEAHEGHVFLCWDSEAANV